MKCEIIEGKLVVTPRTPTEVWAFNEWLSGRNHWDRVPDVVVLGQPAQPATPPAAQHQDELDAVFGPSEG